MSLWLQEEMKKLEERRKKNTPSSKGILAIVIVFALIEAALFLWNQVTPDYDTLPLCGIVGVMGLLILVILTSKSKSTPNKPMFSNALKCMEEMHLSPEELKQFDAEMMAAPLFRMEQEKNRPDFPLTVTEHYLTGAYPNSGELDYGIYRLSDIAMTCHAASQGTFYIDLLNARAEKIGGLSLQGNQIFAEFNTAMERFAPAVRLNVPMKEVKKIRKNA